MIDPHFAFKLAWAVAGLAVDRVRARRRPFVVNHLVTVRCNLACPFCYVSGPEQKAFNQKHYSRGTELDTAEVLRFYRQLIALDFKLAVIVGGEPLLRSDLDQLLWVLRGHTFVSLFTNGWLLADRAELAAPASSLFVSLDAPDAQHDEVRAMPGCFDRAVAGIARMRRRYPTVRLALNMTVTGRNAHRVGDMLAFARDQRLPIAFQPPTYQGQFAVDGRPCEASARHTPGALEVAEAFRKVRSAAAAGQCILGTRAFFDLIIEDHPSYPCHYPGYVLGPVLPNGDVVACTTSRVVANVRATPVAEVLSDPAWRANAEAGPTCPRGCRDWGIHDVSAIYGGRMSLPDLRRYRQAFVTA